MKKALKRKLAKLRKHAKNHGDCPHCEVEIAHVYKNKKRTRRVSLK